MRAKKDEWFVLTYKLALRAVVGRLVLVLVLGRVLVLVLCALQYSNTVRVTCTALHCTASLLPVPVLCCVVHDLPTCLPYLPGWVGREVGI